MKKFIVLIITCLIVLIVIQEIRIFRIHKLNHNLSDTLQKCRTQLHFYKEQFRFDQITCTPIFDKFVKTGDDLVVKVVLSAQNVVYKGNGVKEAFVTLGQGFDGNHNLYGIYDTVFAKDWLCKLKIKTKGLGTDTVYGAFNIPWDSDKLACYSFCVPYCKINTATYKDLVKAGK